MKRIPSIRQYCPKLEQTTYIIISRHYCQHLQSVQAKSPIHFEVQGKSKILWHFILRFINSKIKSEINIVLNNA